MREETATALVSAPPRRSFRWVFWCLAVFGLALDQGSKYTVVAALCDEAALAALHHEAASRNSQRTLEKSVTLIPRVFAFTVRYTTQPIDKTNGALGPLRSIGGVGYLPHLNHGALWGVGGRNERDEPGSDFNTFFAWISLLAAVAIAFWITRTRAGHDRILCGALGLILAGTLGNLYDRLVFGGVRDFLHWQVFEFPIFNIADCCLVCGAFLLVVQAFYSQPRAAVQTAAVATAVNPAAASLANGTLSQPTHVAEVKST